MPKLNLIVARHVGLLPTDLEASEWLDKHVGEAVTAEIRVQRSPQHNRMFWSVAAKTHANLPEPYSTHWPTPYDMTKGLQLAFGYVDQIMKPVKGGEWEVVRVPSSLDFSNMDQETFNEVSEKLFAGMAHCLNVTVDELLNESRAA